MKIIVYTILKNEINNIDAWLENVKHADAIFLLDTGSTDGSLERLEELKKDYPNLYLNRVTYQDFRFDKARNDNLEMVRLWAKLTGEEDAICWTIDLDERFADNLYDITQEAFVNNPKCGVLRYLYANRTPNHEVINQRFCIKCHRLNGAYWESPVHEYQRYQEGFIYDEVTVCPDKILVSHYQNKKSDRAQYKELALKRIQEDKFDIIGWKHYLDGCIDGGDDFDTILSVMLQIYGKLLQLDRSIPHHDWLA